MRLFNRLGGNGLALRAPITYTTPTSSSITRDGVGIAAGLFVYLFSQVQALDVVCPIKFHPRV